MIDTLFTIVTVVTQEIKDQCKRIKKLASIPVENHPGILQGRSAGYSKKTEKSDSSDSTVIYHYGIDEHFSYYHIDFSDLVNTQDVIERFKAFGYFLSDQLELPEFEALVEALTHANKNWKVDQTSGVYPKPESRMKSGNRLVKDLKLRTRDLTPEQEEAIRAIFAEPVADVETDTVAS